jgi:hypothetical protein
LWHEAMTGGSTVVGIDGKKKGRGREKEIK